MEYWIDGYFYLFWSGKSYKCGDRDIFVPKFATLRVTTVEPHRIWIEKSFVLKQIVEFERLKKEKRFNPADYKHYLLKRFCEALNAPWVEEPYVEPRIKTSLW